jgi:hypothetical protein
LFPSCPQVFKLCNSNGKLFVTVGDRPLEAFVAVLDDTGLHLTPNDKNLANYKVSAELAAFWAAVAAKAASRPRL